MTDTALAKVAGATLTRLQRDGGLGSDLGAFTRSLYCDTDLAPGAARKASSAGDSASTIVLSPSCALPRL